MALPQCGGHCCRCEPQHSGQMFDWWRYSQDGRIVKLPEPTPPKCCPLPPPCLGDLCWPLPCSATKRPQEECEISRDFWPDKGDRSGKSDKLRCQGVRPPWVPTQLPNQWGVVKYPPPYTHYCRDRAKQPNFVCKV